MNFGVWMNKDIFLFNDGSVKEDVGQDDENYKFMFIVPCNIYFTMVYLISC